MQRIVGIDFGLKRIGVSISDVFKSFAIPLFKIENGKTDEITAELLLQSLKDHPHIEQFVIGLPIHLDGKESEMSAKVRSFAKVLETLSQKPVFLLDERLTSKQAESLLRERAMNRKDRSKVVDILASALILESYLSSINLQSCNKS